MYVHMQKLILCVFCIWYKTCTIFRTEKLFKALFLSIVLVQSSVWMMGWELPAFLNVLVSVVEEHWGQCDMEHNIYWPVLGMTCLSHCGPTNPKNIHFSSWVMSQTQQNFYYHTQPDTALWVNQKIFPRF